MSSGWQNIFCMSLRKQEVEHCPPSSKWRYSFGILVTQDSRWELGKTSAFTKPLFLRPLPRCWIKWMERRNCGYGSLDLDLCLWPLQISFASQTLLSRLLKPLLLLVNVLLHNWGCHSCLSLLRLNEGLFQSPDTRGNWPDCAKGQRKCPINNWPLHNKPSTTDWVLVTSRLWTSICFLSKSMCFWAKGNVYSYEIGLLLLLHSIYFKNMLLHFAFTTSIYFVFIYTTHIVLYAWNMHDQLLFIIMCQNEIKTKRKWHIDSCSLAPVCVFSRSAKFSPCDPPARLQCDFILQSRDGRRPTGSRHLESSSLRPVLSFTLLRVHDQCWI